MTNNLLVRINRKNGMYREWKSKNNNEEYEINNNNLYFVLETWDITAHFITYILYSYTKIITVD